MQYILSEEEMQAVRTDRAALAEMVKILPNKEKLQKMCSKIANEWAVCRGWDGKQEPTTWDCVLTVEYEHCCDECPVQTICPNPRKSWSK